MVSCSEVDPTDTPSAKVLPTEVLVHTLSREAWQGTIQTFGVVEALEEVDVAAELSGTVKAVHVNEGDRVEAGQLLLELDAQKRQFAVQQADQQVERARAALEEARLKLQRRRNLAEKETISQEVLDNAQLAVDAASAAFQQAVASGQLAHRELADTRIYSPTAGLVDVKAVEAGEPVAAGGTLVTLQAAVGSATPPFGCDIFTAQLIFRRPYLEVIGHALPFLLILILATIILIAFPQIALFLPRLAMGG